MKKLVGSIAAALLLATLAIAQTAPQPAGTPPASQPASPIAAGAKPVKISDGFKFTEGATANKDGDIFFIDQPNDRIMQWSWSRDTPGDLTKGKMEVFLHPSGYSNGMCFDKDGNLISCADEKNELWSITPDKKVTVLIKDNNSKPLNGPNDVWVRPDGGMYLTDPLYARDWWTDRPGGKGMQQPGKYVYYFPPDHKKLTPVIMDFRTPNGIIGTPDGKMLYVSDIDGGKTFSYTIKDDGTLADKKLFCNAGSDGMTIDSEGNIYTTAGNARTGMQIWSKEGKLIERIPLGCANCCFGGKEKDILFINCATEVYGVKMRTHGVGPS